MPSGAVYSVEIARTPEETAQGLMYRESLPPRHGMIFTFTDGGVHSFWMKNTMIPLDIVWIDADGKVLFVSANTPPCTADPCPDLRPRGPGSDRPRDRRRPGREGGSARRLDDPNRRSRFPGTVEITHESPPLRIGPPVNPITLATRPRFAKFTEQTEACRSQIPSQAPAKVYGSKR